MKNAIFDQGRYFHREQMMHSCPRCLDQRQTVAHKIKKITIILFVNSNQMEKSWDVHNIESSPMWSPKWMSHVRFFPIRIHRADTCKPHVHSLWSLDLIFYWLFTLAYMGAFSRGHEAKNGSDFSQNLQIFFLFCISNKFLARHSWTRWCSEQTNR